MAKSSALAFLALLFVSYAAASDACTHIVGYNYYDLNDLFKDKTGANQALTITSATESNDLVLDMCHNQTVVDCSVDTFAALANGTTCSAPVTSANYEDYKDLKWKEKDSDDDDDDKKKVKVTYPLGGACSSSSSLADDNDDSNDDEDGYKLTVYLSCPDDRSDPLVSNFSIDGCDITANITSKHACPTFNESVIITFINQYSYVFGALLCAFGAFLIFRGNEKFAWTIGIIGFLTTFVIVGSLGYEYVLNPQPQTAPSTGWIIWGVAAVLGIGAGVLLGKFYKGALFLLGGWLGVILAFFLNPIVLYKIQLSPPSLTLYLAMGIFGIALGFLALFVEAHMKIIATSILGAYALTRGLSFFLGGFPAETELADKIEAGDMNSIPYTIFLYFTLLCVLSVVGIFTQYRRKEEAEEQEERYQKL